MRARRAKRERLRVRVYNVLFGDAILVSVPDAGTVRHILIDVGNVQGGPGGRTDVFEPVMDDIVRELDGAPVDLYVMTHEHMDHVKGLSYAAERLGLKLKARYAWLTASADPDYYAAFPDAQKQRRIARLALDSARAFLAASPDPRLASLLVNNDYRSTDACVAHLRRVAKKTSYAHRAMKLERTHPFKEAKLKVLAPEHDVTDYYGAFHPAAFFFGENGTAGNGAAAVPAPPERPIPPAGVDVSAFHNLLDARACGHADNLFTIDRAANNTSIVFSLEWRGWKLLFAGDAEIRSWRTMHAHGALGPVHFLKIAHHGSSNGTPSGELLDVIFPVKAPDRRKRRAVLSTCLETYSGVPHDETLQRLAGRCEVQSVLDLAEDELYLDVFFDG